MEESREQSLHSWCNFNAHVRWVVAHAPSCPRLAADGRKSHRQTCCPSESALHPVRLVKKDGSRSSMLPCNKERAVMSRPPKCTLHMHATRHAPLPESESIGMGSSSSQVVEANTPSASAAAPVPAQWLCTVCGETNRNRTPCCAKPSCKLAFHISGVAITREGAAVVASKGRTHSTAR